MKIVTCDEFFRTTDQMTAGERAAVAKIQSGFSADDAAGMFSGEPTPFIEAHVVVAAFHGCHGRYLRRFWKEYLVFVFKFMADDRRQRFSAEPIRPHLEDIANAMYWMTLGSQERSECYFGCNGFVCYCNRAGAS